MFTEMYGTCVSGSERVGKTGAHGETLDEVRVCVRVNALAFVCNAVAAQVASTSRRRCYAQVYGTHVCPMVYFNSCNGFGKLLNILLQLLKLFCRDTDGASGRDTVASVSQKPRLFGTQTKPNVTQFDRSFNGPMDSRGSLADPT